MSMLRFHVEEFPEYEGMGARYVVIAYCGAWRDGVATNNPQRIAGLELELRKRFMDRFNRHAA